MINLLDAYAKLYAVLTGPVLDSLLARDDLDSYDRSILRQIVHIHHPFEAESEQIESVLRWCREEGIGDRYLAAESGWLESAMEQVEDALLDPGPGIDYSLNDLGRMMAHTQSIVLVSQHTLGRVAQQTDYTLKGLCPDCNGDLAVVVEQSISGDLELRLKCHQCSQGGLPPTTRWIVTRVTEQP